MRLASRRSVEPAIRMADGGRFDLDGIGLRLKVNPRSRRISLRIDPRTGEAVAMAPSARRLGDAVAFARARRDWLSERLAARAKAARLESIDAVDLFGASHTLRPDGRRPRLGPGVIRGCGDGVVDPQLVVRAIRGAALAVFRDRVAVHCARLDTPTPRVSLSNAHSRWGSCTATKAGHGASVRLSWRLALAPFAVADYVVAHECAHLLEQNHGPKFWALVRELVGEPSPHRAWLRREGQRLHGFGRAVSG